MTRRAILIGCPNTANQNPLPGTALDVAQYYTFLRTPVGGAWRSNEIVRLIDRPRDEIREAIQAASEVDYSFVLFSGHGSHPHGNPDQLSTRIRLDGGTMSARDLDPGNGKSTIVVDSCRTQGNIVKSVFEYLIENRRVSARAPARPDLEEYREAFDYAVVRCPEQTTYLFGCSIGQSAKDDPNLGGLFPRTLLSRAIAWERNQNSRNGILNVHSVLARAAMLVALDSDLEQIPRIQRDGVVVGRHFPFAIVRPQ
jgi:Caspase domain